MSPRFILLHSPLVGPLTWQAAAEELRRRGFDADAPAWLALSEIEGGYYDDLAAELAGRLGEVDQPVILVAHSAAGGLVCHLARHLAAVTGVILVDAIHPHPAKSWFDTAPPDLAQQLRAGALAGSLPPWDQWWPPGALERLVPDAEVREALTGGLDPLPLAYFEEAAPPTAFTGPTAYLQLSGAYDGESQAAARYGWPLVRLPLHHLAMLTHPETVAAALVTLSERLTDPAHG